MELAKKPVYVEWVDSKSSTLWVTPTARLAENMECVTLGFIIWESDKVIAVAASISALDYGCDPISIPKCAITRIQDVEWV